MVDTRTRFEAFDNLTRKHALVCVPPEGIATEDIVLSVGKIIGNQNVRAASKMNKKIVVFVSDEKFVHDVVSSGLTTETGLFILASPMDTPSMRIVISNVPPFITNDKLMCILSRYGTVVSKISMIPLRARDERIKHVMSFRRQVYMILPDRGDDTGLNISFKVTLNKYEYQMYATSASLTCFNCGAFGHVKRFCPKVSCVKCGEAGHNDTDCEKDMTPVSGVENRVTPNT